MRFEYRLKDVPVLRELYEGMKRRYGDLDDGDYVHAEVELRHVLQVVRMAEAEGLGDRIGLINSGLRTLCIVEERMLRLERLVLV